MILSRYFAWRFLVSFLTVLFLFVLLNASIDMVEQARRLSGTDVGLTALLTLTVLNLPSGLYGLLPLIMVLAAIWLFLGLARSSELVVTRAAGRSALRSLVAPLVVALAIGVVTVAVFNPIVAGTLKAYEARSMAMRDGPQSTLRIFDDGLWLRQGDGAGQTVIRAATTNLDGTELQEATFLSFTTEGGPVRRIEADRARLEDGAWVLTEAKVWVLVGDRVAEAAATRHPTLRIPSSLSADQIRDSFGTPASISVWDLPRFISRLEAAGFSALRHRVWLHSELAKPFFLVSMLLIAAGFTMRHQRGRRVGLMVLTAILLSFALYFLRSFAQILGENGQIPVFLAAWAPPVSGIAAAIGLLLHLEEG